MLCNIHPDDWHDRIYKICGEDCFINCGSGNYKKLVLPAQTLWGVFLFFFSCGLSYKFRSTSSQRRSDNPRISRKGRDVSVLRVVDETQFPIYRTTIPFSDIEGRGDGNLYDENRVTAESGVPQLSRYSALEASFAAFHFATPAAEAAASSSLAVEFNLHARF